MISIEMFSQRRLILKEPIIIRYFAHYVDRKFGPLHGQVIW